MSFLKSRLITVLIAFALLTLTFVFVKRGATQSQQNGQKSMADTIRTDGLRQAAKTKGHYETTVRTTGWMKYDLESLTSHSSTIVVGTPFESSAALTDADSIQTEYRVKVNTVLKGDIGTGDVLTVKVLGGKVIFEDGTSAELTAEDLGPILKNHSYVFFLKPSQLSSIIFVLTGGGQGLFEVDSQGSVTPRGDKKDVVQKHANENVSAFIAEIKAAIKKYPNTLPCCQ